MLNTIPEISSAVLQLQQAVDAINAANITFNSEITEIKTAILEINTKLNNKLATAAELVEQLESSNTLKSRVLQMVNLATQPETFIMPPQQVAVIPSYTTLNTKWETVLGATSYIVKYKESDTLDEKTLLTSVNGVTISNLKPNTFYEVYVTSVKGASTSGPSKSILISTLNNN